MSKNKIIGLQSDGDTSTENTTSSSNEILVEKREVTGTPFSVISYDGREFLAWGQYRVSLEMTREQMDEFTEKVEGIEKAIWSLMGDWVMAMIEARDRAIKRGIGTINEKLGENED